MIRPSVSDPDDIDALVEALADLRLRVAPLVLARQERRRGARGEGERLTTPQHITLVALADGPRSVSDVAAGTGVAVSTATRMLQGLERAGFVERAALGGEDRRLRPVALTDEGRRVMEEADEVARARLRGLARRLDAGGRRAVLEGLAAFAAALQQDEEERSAKSASAASSSESEGAGGSSGVAAAGRMPSRMTPR